MTEAPSLAECRDAMNGRDWPAGFDLLRRAAAAPEIRHDQILSIGQMVARIPAEADLPRLKIAVLGYGTLTLHVAAVRAAAAREGFVADVYEAPYNAMRQDILDGTSGLWRAAPEIVLLAPASQDLASLPSGPADDIAARLDEEVRGWETLWQRLGGLTGRGILQQTLVRPEETPRGMLERRLPWSAGSYVAAANARLLEAAPADVTWLDVDALADRLGRLVWHDPRLFHSAKMPFAPRVLPEYASLLHGGLAAALGRGRKALVVDLDNTLWGGVIGDDGIDGIALGPGTPAGEAHQAFCAYLKDLAARGVILAVCSKNDPAIAREVFERHPHMPLASEDFAAFVCNWGDKAGNLRAVARSINIGTDALVFVDDNPAERELIRRELPEVGIVELPKDPVLYIRAVEAGHWFDAATLTDSDLKRAASYRARAAAELLREQATDLSAYLDGLKMSGTVRRAAATDVPRLAQMEAKTNQFNTTTRRVSAADLAARLGDPDWRILTLDLRDAFADHGLIAYIAAHREENRLRITDWLMSCRVFSRTAEDFLFNALLAEAREMGVTEIVGEFHPSAKNGVVADLYPRFGFHAIATDGGGHRFALPLAGAADRPTPIRAAVS